MMTYYNALSTNNKFKTTLKTQLKNLSESKDNKGQSFLFRKWLKHF